MLWDNIPDQLKWCTKLFSCHLSETGLTAFVIPKMELSVQKPEISSISLTMTKYVTNCDNLEWQSIYTPPNGLSFENPHQLHYAGVFPVRNIH